jgi:hypothetical protein
VLSAGRAVVAAPVGADDVEDDFLGLPGLLSPEQTASLLARRDVEIARRVARPGPGRAVPDPVAAAEGAAWEQVVALRREVNRLVGAVAARTGEPHSSVHSKLRRAVPGPPSAAASLDILAARRDRLRRGL